MREFESDKKIQLAMTMLDWTNRELYFPSEASDRPIALTVNDALLCSALLPHQCAGRYSKEEAMIRDCFDHFLDMLVMFWNFIEADLVNCDELRPYMQYWIRLVSGQVTDWHSPQVFTLLLNHIRAYGFTGAALLIKSFGYNPQPSKAAVDEAIQATLASRADSIGH